MRKELAILMVGLFALSAFAGCVGGEETGDENPDGDGDVVPDDVNPVADNQKPVAKMSISGSLETDAEIKFSGAESTDSDGNITKYEWDFEADGTFDAMGEAAAHTYNSVGNYTIILKVTDDDGATASDTRKIAIAEAGAGEEVDEGPIPLSGPLYFATGMTLSEAAPSGSSEESVDMTAAIYETATAEFKSSSFENGATVGGKITFSCWFDFAAGLMTTVPGMGSVEQMVNVTILDEKGNTYAQKSEEGVVFNEGIVPYSTSFNVDEFSIPAGSNLIFKLECTHSSGGGIDIPGLLTYSFALLYGSSEHPSGFTIS